ncbi:uncharacterized protein LOC119740386 [Patiria miniata]|uniref:Gag protein n=1 Tax=Patiria miniata TaxID=46514 RepID=A0A914B6Z6_PATMI|nr:uncharacterized protein LOC119740386 [Patiria miniata]
MADALETDLVSPELETRHQDPLMEDLHVHDRPQRERHPTAKALYNNIITTEKTLHQNWRKTSQNLKSLSDAPEEQAVILHNLSSARSALQSYTELWSKLDQLYREDQTGEFIEDALRMKMTFFENANYANCIISQGANRLYQIALETQSSCSRLPSTSGRFQKSTSSSVQSAKVHALAAAAAAAQNAAFEEVIAKRTADMKVLHMTSEAEKKIDQARREVEQQTKLASAEADLQILRARQAAAIEKAKSDAFLQADQEDTTGESITSPHQSSNDHALRFLNQTDKVVDATLTSQLQASTPSFQPSVEQTVTLSSTPGDVSPTTPKPPLPVTPIDGEQPLLNLTREISDTLAHQRQPTHEPDVYDGDPIMFQPWRCAFETMVNHAHTPATQKLTFLAKYTKGEVRKLVDRFRHRYVSSPETAYQEAWKELKERFGNKTNITTAIIRKLIDFPRFKAEENRKLQELADLCVDAAAQMNDLPDLNILNYAHNLHPILEKLPTYIHNAWRKRASEHKTAKGNYPPFTMLAEFLKQKARLHNDPELYPSSKILHPTPEKPRTDRSRGSSLRVLATSTPTKSTSAPLVMSTPTKSATASTVQAKEKCQFHDIQGHRLSECIAFGRKPIQERRQFCMDRGLCFKCGSNHRMKECETKVQCRKCKSTEHASFMHINQKQNEGEVQSEKQPANSHKDVVANTKCTRFLTCSSARSCSKIVLCKIYHKDHPTNSILGYAVLDDQSNACLGGPEVFEALNLAGPAFPYELSTCGGDKITSEGRRACGLIVESQDGKLNSYLPLSRMPTFLVTGVRFQTLTSVKTFPTSGQLLQRYQRCEKTSTSSFSLEEIALSL